MALNNELKFISSPPGRPIVHTNGVIGGTARIDGTRIPVWLLENYRRLAWSEQTILESYPSINANDLYSAFAYAQAHGGEIDADIKSNELD